MCRGWPKWDFVCFSPTANGENRATDKTNPFGDASCVLRYLHRQLLLMPPTRGEVEE